MYLPETSLGARNTNDRPFSADQLVVPTEPKLLRGLEVLAHVIFTGSCRSPATLLDRFEAIVLGRTAGFCEEASESTVRGLD
jgi:hypothetical protein